MTEPLTAQISRALNPLLLVGGTRNASIGSQRLSHRYMHEWTTFTAEVNDILARLDLTGNISLTDPAPGEGDRYIVANELGLTSRFVANVALPLNKAYSLTTQGTLMFGDVQADSSISSSLFPDASILYMQDNECEVRAVGELKTYWTFPLERHPISSTIPGRRMGLEPHIGQLVSYMREYSLKYGWLSTYKATVFVRRTEPYRFELSLPLLHDATRPSVRECFLAFGNMVQSNHHYFEPPDFNPSVLRMDATILASDRVSLYRPIVPALPPSTGSPASNGHRSTSTNNGNRVTSGFRFEDVTAHTAFIGAEGKTFGLVSCGQVLSGRLPGKTVLDVVYEGQPAVAKFYPADKYDFFSNELTVYKKLQEAMLSPEKSGYFARLLGCGVITCSSLLPRDGSLLILEKVSGVPFSDELWEDLQVEGRELLESKLRIAVGTLREIGLVHGDPSKANVLFDVDAGRPVLIDFEHALHNSYNLGVDDGPELYSIMGAPNR